MLMLVRDSSFILHSHSFISSFASLRDKNGVDEDGMGIGDVLDAILY